MYSHHFVDCSKCMFVFIAFLNISGADTGFQKRGVVIINNKTSGGGGGGGFLLRTTAREKKKVNLDKRGGCNPPPPLPCICSCILSDDKTYI